MNLRRIQVCKTRDFFCKLAFFANLPRRHDTPWHFARTDIGCPRSRAKKMYALARREMSRRARSLHLLLLFELGHVLTELPSSSGKSMIVYRQPNRRRRWLCPFHAMALVS